MDDKQYPLADHREPGVKYLSASEYAEKAGISGQSARNRIRAGRIPGAVQESNARYYVPADVAPGRSEIPMKTIEFTDGVTRKLALAGDPNLPGDFVKAFDGDNEVLINKATIRTITDDPEPETGTDYEER